MFKWERARLWIWWSWWKLCQVIELFLGYLVSPNELIIWTVYRRGTWSWRFEREATSRDVSFVISLLWQMYVINSSSLRQRAHAPNVTSRKSLRWPIYILNSVVKTKLSCNTPTEVGLQFLQRLKPFIHFFSSCARHFTLCCVLVSVETARGEW